MARIILALIVLSASAFAQQRAENRPNILLITADHMRADNIAAHGSPWMQTPNFDRLVREGTSFRQAFIQGIACSPSRASLFTGRYPRQHGVRTNGIQLPETEITLTHVLGDAGYYTGQFGKLHFWPHSERNHRAYHPPYGFHEMQLADEPGCYDDAYGRWLWTQGSAAREAGRVIMPAERTGFDYYSFAGEDRLTHAWWAASETIGFIERNKDKPWFAHVGFYAPHPPLNPPDSQLKRYDGVKLPERAARSGEMDLMPPRYQKGAQRWDHVSEEKWRDYRKHFYAMVSNVDLQIGRILETLEKAGITENTVLVFTSDHGDYLGDHGLNGKSALAYDEVYNVPLIFWGKGVPNRGIVNALAELVDVVPTLLKRLDLPIPRGVKGLSLLSVIEGGQPVRDSAYAENPEMRMIRTADAKYAYHPGDQEVLFDLRTDPHEHRNLINEPSARQLLEQMRARMREKDFELWDNIPERIAPY